MDALGSTPSLRERFRLFCSYIRGIIITGKHLTSHIGRIISCLLYSWSVIFRRHLFIFLLHRDEPFIKECFYLDPLSSSEFKKLFYVASLHERHLIYGRIHFFRLILFYIFTHEDLIVIYRLPYFF